jgi:hypothetical protein
MIKRRLLYYDSPLLLHDSPLMLPFIIPVWICLFLIAILAILAGAFGFVADWISEKRAAR